MDRIKQFYIFLYGEKTFLIFWALSLFALIGFSYVSISADLLATYEVRAGLLIALINLILALLTIKRIQLLAILFCWNSIIASILSVVYIYKALL